MLRVSSRVSDDEDDADNDAMMKSGGGEAEGGALFH